MFVFPAFNNSYKKRKRTFICCQECRERRIKCVLQESYETKGCKSCSDQGTSCDLIQGNVPQVTDNGSTFTTQDSEPTVDADRYSTPLSNVRVTPSISDANNGQHNGIYAGTSKPLNNYTSTEAAEITPTSQDTRVPYPTTIEVVGGHVNAVNDGRTSSQLTSSSQVSPSSGSGSSHASERSTERFVKSKADFHVSSAFDTRLMPPTIPGKLNAGDPTIKIHILSFLESVGVFHLSNPPLTHDDVRAMLRVYFAKFNCVFPLVHEPTFWQEFDNGKSHTVLVYCLLMFIAKDKLCEPVLKKYFHGDYEHEVTEFVDDLECKIRGSL